MGQEQTNCKIILNDTTMFTQKIAIDLGTANTIIIVDGQIVVDEPSVVAIRRKDETMVAVGRKAAADWRRSFALTPLCIGVSLCPKPPHASDSIGTEWDL